MADVNDYTVGLDITWPAPGASAEIKADQTKVAVALFLKADGPGGPPVPGTRTIMKNTAWLLSDKYQLIKELSLSRDLLYAEQGDVRYFVGNSVQQAAYDLLVACWNVYWNSGDHTDAATFDGTDPGDPYVRAYLFEDPANPGEYLDPDPTNAAMLLDHRAWYAALTNGELNALRGQ